MDQLTSQLSELLQRLSVSHWGVADITGMHPLAEKFPRALSMAMAYYPEFGVYNEQQYYDLLEENRAHVVDATQEVSLLLASRDIKHFTVPQGGQDPETLLARFPHKLAAVRAGMGWIGKNSLLITKNHGPRLSLATILIDNNIAQGEPVTSDKCGDCRVCVDACPYGCIKNVNWYPGIAREALFDAHLCSSKREEFIPAIGHKHECGLCLLACPWGGRQIAGSNMT